jgi:hypothetical protein
MQRKAQAVIAFVKDLCEVSIFKLWSPMILLPLASLKP